ncbi:long-chain acyl-CoA synthetase [Monocercomonoides exilis]|uniref:long-chain acyl-CoA synthetase n=1 Tax=Monocercomonoides exilis TaxID=2049356 RepID=UPI003559DF3A|nr:long-chain acyl-CoA synthetase [Monocercomonoides exilis]|eukprot:MONOS_10222.1-p1 / transcript=MONOS_10222.1 / gene=MONOS_10222 / organism=Monocercomonoides_exilis_PA203 / gene_product=long-chain acyl-CoA synthetase [EC:6.2.1.3] / transcript_product=long-chain acyl-CoA synthetase [EC:6.2.1.3] / location=Mono_scaffold00455:28943-31147(+) / protein_length=735 / sequence_SO=supercontig / SO=protein_coding / is_pseudo=false
MEIDNKAKEYGEVHGTTQLLPDWLNGLTRYEALVKAMAKNGHLPCQGRRAYLSNGKRGEYEWEDGNTVLKKVNFIALALKSFGLKKGDTVGIMSRNRPEWTIVDIACSSQGYVTVPIYDSYGPEICEKIISVTKQVLVFTATENVSFVKQAVERCPTVQRIVVFDGNPPDNEIVRNMLNGSCESPHDIKAVGFSHLYTELLQMGSSIFDKDPFQNIANPEFKGDDVSTIVFTSGTAGIPKGAILRDNSLLKGGWALLGRCTNFPEQDIVVSYLPLAHIFERGIEIYSLTDGIGIGYFSGSIPKLTEDLFYLKPTLFPVVPRVLAKILGGIQDQIAKMPKVVRWFFKGACFLREKEIYNGWWTRPLSEVILRNIKAKFGGRLRITFSGSAPLSPAVGKFLDVIMGCRVLQGYGQTEACGASLSQSEIDWEYGAVGVPLPGVECCLCSVPEMGYFALDKVLHKRKEMNKESAPGSEDEEGFVGADGVYRLHDARKEAARERQKGEVCIRGDSVFIGYFEDEKQTAIALRDGWLHTGDVGEWLPGGQLRIIDRLKNVFKLQQGEYIYIEEIEQALVSSPVIGQVMLYGESCMNGLIGIVVPQAKALAQWAEKEGMKDKDEWKKCWASWSKERAAKKSEGASSSSSSSSTAPSSSEQDEEFIFMCEAFQPANQYVLSHINTVLREAKRKGYEIPRYILLTPEEFSIENGMLTPTHKIRRENIKKTFFKQLEQMKQNLL